MKERPTFLGGIRMKKELQVQIIEEYKDYLSTLAKSRLFTKEEILKMKETQAYKDAIINPNNIWCKCRKEWGTTYKTDGEVYLGVEKHSFICNHCKKYRQIG